MSPSTQTSDKLGQGNVKLFTASHDLHPNRRTQDNRKSLQEQLKERLPHLLQSTLDLEQQLQLFFQEMTRALNVDGIEYSNSSEMINLSLGQRATHSCSYRLLTEKDYNGEISFCRRSRFDENELQVIESTLGQLVYPLRNALQYRQAVQMALQDPLTGAGNRIAMDNALHRELEVCTRNNQPLSILLLDLDHFKQVNDTYGHSAGDLALKQTVEGIRQAVRNVDLIFRYGGEEFVVLLGNSGLENSMVVAERIRTQIENTQCNYQGQDIPITTSIGVACYNQNEPIRETLERADQALYKAKNSGRNRIHSLK